MAYDVAGVADLPAQRFLIELRAVDGHPACAEVAPRIVTAAAPWGTYAAGVSEPAHRQLGIGDLDEFRRTGHALIDAVADHLEALPGRPVWQPLPDDLRAALLELPLPNGPTGLEALAGTMARDVLPHAMGNGHPAFFGWVNSPPALAGVLATRPRPDGNRQHRHAVSE